MYYDLRIVFTDVSQLDIPVNQFYNIQVARSCDFNQYGLFNIYLAFSSQILTLLIGWMQINVSEEKTINESGIALYK